MTASRIPVSVLACGLLAVCMGCGRGSDGPSASAADGGPQLADIDAPAGPGTDVGTSGTPIEAGNGPASDGGFRDDAGDASTRGDGVDGASSGVAVAALGHCIGPAGAKPSDAQAAYAKWKSDLVTNNGAGGFRRVRRPSRGRRTTLPRSATFISRSARATS